MVDFRGQEKTERDDHVYDDHRSTDEGNDGSSTEKNDLWIVVVERKKRKERPRWKRKKRRGGERKQVTRFVFPFGRVRVVRRREWESIQYYMDAVCIQGHIHTQYTGGGGKIKETGVKAVVALQHYCTMQDGMQVYHRKVCWKVSHTKQYKLKLGRIGADF